MAYITSENYKSMIYSEDSNQTLTLVINGKTVNSDYIRNFNLKETIFETDYFSLGSATISEVELELDNDVLDEIGTFNEIEVSHNLSLTDDTVETIPLGKYIVKKIDNQSNLYTKYTLYDYMDKFNVEIDFSSIVPCTRYEVLEYICEQCGVPLKNKSILNGDVLVNVYDNSITARTYLSLLSERSGGFAYITRDNMLEIKSFSEVDSIDLPLNRIGEYIVNNKRTISKLIYENATQKFEIGDDSGEIIFLNSDSPFSCSQEEVENIFNVINGLSYQSLELRIWGDPSVDRGDIIKANNLISFAQKEWTFGNGFYGKYKTTLKDSQNKSYVSKLSNSQKIRRVQSKLNEIEGEIKLVVEETDENTQAISDLKISLDGIETSVSKKADISYVDEKLQITNEKTDMTPLAIEKCAAKDTIDFKIDGNSYQSDEPSIDIPQEIKSVKGNITLLHTNKNICLTNFESWESGHYATSGNKQNNATRIRLKDLIKVNQKNSYFVNTFSNRDFTFIFRTYDKDKNFVRSIGVIGDNEPLKLNDNDYFLAVSIGLSVDSQLSVVDFNSYKEYFENGTIKPFICLASEQNKSFIEHKEEEITVNMKKKNFIDVRDYVEKNSDYYTIDEDENVTCIKVDNRSGAFTYFLELPSGTYTLCTTNPCNLRVFESDDSSFPSMPVSFQTNDKNNIVFTTTKPFVTIKTFSNTLPYEIGKIRLFEGTNTDEYYELASLDDVKDELLIDDEGNVTLIQRVGKIVMDDSRNYQLSSLDSSFECTRFRTNQVIPDNSLDAYVGLSNKFITRLPNTPSEDYEYILFGNGHFYFAIKKSRLKENTGAAFKNWIGENPVTMYYRLDEEKRILLDSKRIRLFKETNVFSLKDNLDTNLFIKYYLDNEFQDSFSTVQETNAMIKIASDEIENKVSTTYATVDNLNNNYYTKTNVEDMIINSETGVTNTFSEAGGNNVFRNTGLWFGDSGQDSYEFWEGKAKRGKNDNASLYSSILLQAGTFKQEQEVPNGNYSVSFYYTKLNSVATATVTINDKTYPLESLETKQFFTGEEDENGNYIVLPLKVSSNHLSIAFTTDVNNSIEIYDLMVNKGTVKLAYSQNENEVTTDTVNISKGITITSSVNDVQLKANADGIRVLNKNNDEKITEFTDKGMTTKQAVIEEEANICKAFFFDAGDQTWITRL